MKISFFERGAIAVLFLSVFIFTPRLALGQTASANAYAVTSSNQLVRFNTASPGTTTAIGPITNLQAGENIVGIDSRPATGELYALGSTSRLYVINRTTAAATLVASLSTPLSGTVFGVDFNPVVDRLRIVSDTGQNLRVNPTNGVAIVDGTLNGGPAGVDAAAYSNSFSGATTTTLFDISAATDTLYTQNPPNAGTLCFGWSARHRCHKCKWL